MMIFRQLFERESCTYTYLLADADTGEAVLIDPVITELDSYERLLSELNLQLCAALDTHVHADHITALGELRQRTGCRSMMGAQALSECVSHKFSDGEYIHFGAYALQVLYTPGHTDDSYSFLLQTAGEHYLFSGDTLLIRGTGRTDFQNGSASQQYDSLFGRLLNLPGDTRLYPAHDYKGWTTSTLDEERAHNPRLQVSDREAYIRLMDALVLPNPKLMDVAVPANRACGQSPV